MEIRCTCLGSDAHRIIAARSVLVSRPLLDNSYFRNVYSHFALLERSAEENANKCESGKNTNDYAHAQNNLLEPSFTVPQMSKSTNEKTERNQRRTKRRKKISFIHTLKH